MSGSCRYRLWLDDIKPGIVEVSGEQAHYLRNVLRLSCSDKIRLLSGKGYEAIATILKITNDCVELEVGDVNQAMQSSLELTVALPTPKGERADWLIEKLTELDVARIIWMRTSRSVVLTKPGGQREQRWQRLAQAAAKQCGRAQVPEIIGTMTQEEILQIPVAQRYIAIKGGQSLIRQLKSAIPVATATLLIGPEGGFTDTEMAFAYKCGCLGVSLGLHTLRMETAAIVGAAMILCEQSATINTCEQGGE
ncbi:MAG: 16S rRNA (uracil(1498)-N(3))-methyltransferase [Deltaproteobacteria bacterium]|nr:16S rRNA (uracil(1498)-N(3))-methyltransferase [Deltaproteobacteria bacterium]